MPRFFTFLALCLATQLLHAQTGYRLGSGDLISITVFDEPELSMDVRVGDTPTVSYPFLGQISLLDRTPAEIEQQIASGLRGDYLIEPRVTVSIKEYRPFFISGEVMRPGSYPYQPGLNLQKAISLAGGLTERASRSKMFITRGGVGEGREKADMDDIVQPDDVVNIEQSFF